VSISTTTSAPANRASRPSYRARVERILDHAADVRSLFLRTLDVPLPRFLPGMFISIAMPLENEVRVRPYTIVSTPQDLGKDPEPFEVVFNRVPGGVGSAWLFERVVGDEIGFTGPFGAFTLDRPTANELAFIAEGTTIAPIRPMIHRALRLSPAHRIHLLYVAEREQHLLYRAEFETLARAHLGFRLAPMILEAAAPHDRLAVEVRRRWIEADADRSRHFFICGVGQAVIDLRDLLRGAGYERRSVHYERW
jgi:ferredoxin-NADP reductase